MFAIFQVIYAIDQLLRQSLGMIRIYICDIFVIDIDLIDAVYRIFVSIDLDADTFKTDLEVRDRVPFLITGKIEPVLITIVELIWVAGAGLPCADIIELIQPCSGLSVINDDLCF